MAAAELEDIVSLRPAEHLRNKRVSEPRTDASIHIRVVGPEPIEATSRRIQAGKAPLDGQLGQTGIHALSLGLQALRAIAFEDRAIEIPEGEKSGRRAGVCGPSTPQDFVPSLKNVADDSRVVRFLRAGRASRCQQEPID